MGIDCSTHSLAFCIFWNRHPIQWGKVLFEGATIYDRLVDAGDKAHALAPQFDVDYIVMESAILGKTKNVDVTIKLSYVYGAVLRELKKSHTQVETVKPTEWQFYLGNKNFTTAEKAKLKSDFPGMSTSWYSQKTREIRKQRTMDFFNKKWPHMNLTDDDVGDSCGIAYYGYHKLTTRQ